MSCFNSSSNFTNNVTKSNYLIYWPDAGVVEGVEGSTVGPGQVGRVDRQVGLHLLPHIKQLFKEIRDFKNEKKVSENFLAIGQRIYA